MRGASEQNNPYSEVAIYFLRLGFLGFGGPLALMASVQKDLIDDRKWMERERFARALALIKALPGPTATQLSIFSGYVRAGRLGGLLAGAGLILPSFFMMIAIAEFYSSIENLSSSQPILFGIQASAVGVIFDSLWRLAHPYVRKHTFWAVAGVASLIAALSPRAEPFAILGLGLIGLSTASAPRIKKKFTLMNAAGLPILAWVCFKTGAFVFGTGLAIVPILASEVVDRFHWLTHRQFMDALAFGQITPGPVVITATFVGYRVAGWAGAIVATACIFLPAFINMLTWFPIAERRLGGSKRTQAFVEWAVAAVVGCIFVTVVKLGGSVADGNGLFSVLFIAGLSWAAVSVARLPTWVVIPFVGPLLTQISLLLQ